MRKNYVGKLGMLLKDKEETEKNRIENMWK